METRKLILASVVLAAILAQFTAQGLGWLELPGEVIGLEIGSVTMLLQYYFRKKSPPGIE